MPAADPLEAGDVPEGLSRRLADAPGLLVALDFDGTLAPIVEDPAAARMDERVRERLATLAEAPTVAPAVVSGRALADLRQRVPVEGLDYAGNHGLELLVDGERTVPDGAAAWRDAIAAAGADLEDRLADVEGCTIEDKGLTLTVHLRRVPASRRDDVAEVVRDVVGDSDLRTTSGKAIREVRPPVDWDKGRALEALIEAAPSGWLPIYVGDDVTDEDAFSVLGGGTPGLAVLVGQREGTDADYRLADQSAVAPFLAAVAESHGVDRTP